MVRLRSAPTTDSWQLMAVRFYHGFATAIFNTVATAAIAAQYPQRRAAMLSTYSSITIAGRSIAPFLGGFLISVEFRRNEGFPAIWLRITSRTKRSADTVAGIRDSKRVYRVIGELRPEYRSLIRIAASLTAASACSAQ